jgi:hypothetical protein
MTTNTKIDNKKSYVSPRMVVYGDVKEITRSVGTISAIIDTTVGPARTH